jgi:hypothetical protein
MMEVCVCWLMMGGNQNVHNHPISGDLGKLVSLEGDIGMMLAQHSVQPHSPMVFQESSELSKD